MLKTGVTPSLSMIQGPLPRYQISAGTTALVIVDMRSYAGSRESGIGLTLREKGIEAEFAYYFDRIEQIVPNIQQIMAECRQTGVEVIHLTSEAYTDDCRDLSHEWKKQRLFAPLCA